MSPRLNNFNSISPYYDRLATLAFGGCLQVSQKHFIKNIPDYSRILIIGGGTGWILEVLLREKKTHTIVYIDSSPEMIELSKKRIKNIVHSSKLEFLTAPIEEIGIKEQFDVVITNYFLDLFKEEKLQLIISRVGDCLPNEGIWIVTDFTSHPGQKLWQRVWIKIMYLFFKITSNIEADTLLPPDPYFKKHHFIKTESTTFFSGMIESSIYKKVK